MRASARPSEQELALLLAGTAAFRARHHDRLLALAARVDDAALEAFLLRQGMLALLGRRFEQLAGDTVPERFLTRTRAHASQAQRQGVGQQLLTMRLLAALKDAGIRALPLKGPLLGERLYGDAAARLSADVDLLVGASELTRAVEQVLALGYERAPHRRAGAGRPLLHERLLHPNGLPSVELHWRVHWYEERFSAELLARAALGPEGVLIPRPADELAALLLIYARDGLAGLRLASDLAAWWDRYGAELPAGGVAEIAHANPATERALATAALFAERLVGLPADDVLGGMPHSRASRGAARLANWPLRGSAGQVSANISLIDWFLCTNGSWWELTRRHLLLTRDELLTRWPETGTSRREILWLRLPHPLRVVRRYAIALWSVLRRDAWAPLPPSLEASRGG